MTCPSGNEQFRARPASGGRAPLNANSRMSVCRTGDESIGRMRQATDNPFFCAVFYNVARAEGSCFLVLVAKKCTAHLVRSYAAYQTRVVDS